MEDISMDYEMLFYRLLDYMVNEMGMDAHETLDNIGVKNLHEQDEIIENLFEEEE
jgi:hypothetical protein